MIDTLTDRTRYTVDSNRQHEAMNLTNQPEVHSFTEVTVTKADAGTVDACGEILDLKETVNGSTESLCMFLMKSIGTL